MWPFGKRLGSFRQNQDGGVAIIVAAASFLMVVLAALAVDLGSMVLKARDVQGAADLASLAAARDLPRAQQAALATARANLGNQVTVQTTVGVYVGNPAVAPKARFTAGGTQPNAARVVINDRAQLYFAKIFGFDSAPITRQSTAALPGSKPSALFSIGSRLLRLNRGLLNSVLSSLLGSNVSLNVMDYNRLVGADVNLLEFADALAVKLNIEAGDYDALLKHNVTTGQMLEILQAIADDSDKAVLGSLTGARLNVPIKVGDILGVDANARDGLRRALNVDISALELLMAGLETANGNRQLALNGDLNAILADVKIKVAIGEKPNNSAWITVSSGQTPVISTAQTRIYVQAKTKNLVPELLAADLQVFAEVASAEAKIVDIRCSATNRVDVDARPGLLRLTVGNVTNPGDLDNFKRPIDTEELVLAEVLLLPLKVYANVESKDRTWQRLQFGANDIANHTPKTVKAKEITSSLINNLSSQLKIRFLGLQLDWIVKLLSPLLVPLGYILDMILNPLLGLLGIGLGEADVRVLGVNCPGGVGGIPYLVG
ncbi:MULTISPECIES: TadG family pilus assembly protein [unclassified Brevundimonas]|uniref:TadG family pilus assembly protein n=1 Tax=unclassified Brevundimonas TaxID=2622653 RepID=UPI0025B8C0D9|nr:MULTISPECIES: pilus assembly protein TadG-related protein [unclassified Brevundimonas]